MDASKIISPKVIAQFVTGVLLTAIIAAIGAITPDFFNDLGAWGPVLYMAVVSVGSSLAGYLKTDPLRNQVTVLVPGVDTGVTDPNTGFNTE